MYKIEKNTDHLLVRFRKDFGYNEIRAIMHHVTMLQEYPETNDIWLIGAHHALISFGDLETLTNDVNRMYPCNARHHKTAIVVDPGLTEAIALLWVKGSTHRVPFASHVFHTLSDAEEWVGSPVSGLARRHREVRQM